MNFVKSTYQKPVDIIAISLSAMCTIHCLALPLIVVLLPSLAALDLENEAFHLWMVLAVLPSSAFALGLGCKKHQRYRLLIIGLVGLSLLLLAVILGESHLSEFWEKALTLSGAAVIALAHIKNYTLCEAQSKNCECSEH